MSISPISAAQQRDMLAQMRELRETRAAAKQASGGAAASSTGSPGQALASPTSMPDPAGPDATGRATSSDPAGALASKLMRDVQAFLFGDGLNAALQANGQGTTAASGGAGANGTTATDATAADPGAALLADLKALVGAAGAKGGAKDGGTPASNGEAGADGMEAPRPKTAGRQAAHHMLHRMARAIETYEARGRSGATATTTSISA